jgi:hypothetical protein
MGLKAVIIGTNNCLSPSFERRILALNIRPKIYNKLDGIGYKTNITIM